MGYQETKREDKGGCVIYVEQIDLGLESVAGKRRKYLGDEKGHVQSVIKFF